MPYWKGRRFSVGSPTDYLFDDDKSPVPPEGVAAYVRKLMRREGIKPAGAPKKTQTVGERRLDMWENGMSYKDIALHDDKDVDVVRHSIAKARREQRKRQSGQE